MKKISKILRRTTIKQPKTLASSNDAVKPWLELLMDQRSEERRVGKECRL